MKLLVFGNLMSYSQQELTELNRRLEEIGIELVQQRTSGVEGYIYVNVAWQTLLKRVLKAYPELKKQPITRKAVKRQLIDTQAQLDARADALGKSCFAIGERDLEHLDGLVALFKYIIKEFK